MVKDIKKLNLINLTTYLFRLMETSLIEATRLGDTKKVKFLINEGANIHAVNDYALRLAAVHGHFDVVKLLIEKGADIRARNDLALQMAAWNGHYEIIKILQYHYEHKEFLNIIKDFPIVNLYMKNYIRVIRLIQRFIKDYLYKPIYKDGSPGIMITKQIKM